MKEREDYSALYWLAGVLTLALILMFGLFTVFQPGRMYAKAVSLEHEAVARGAETWAHNCATCHGRNGEGVRGSGPALNTKEFLSAATDKLIFDTIQDGRPGTAMPAWGQAQGGPFNAQVIEDLVAFIRAWEPTAPSVAEIRPKGDPVQGAVLFSTTCFACHGVSGEGTSVGLRLNDPERLARLSDDYYRETITRGRPDRGMPTWGSVLSPVQIEDLVAYIRSWQETPPTPMAELGGDPVRGEKVFQSTCVVCHGEAAAGTDVAPSLVDSPILGDREALYDTISNGRLQRGMPRWGQVLSPAEINDVIAYLGRLQSGEEIIAEPTPAEEAVDAAAVAAGQFTFLQRCAPCHGAEAEGREGIPALADNQFVQSNDDEALVSFIQSGRAGTAMAGFKDVLTPEEIGQIVQYLRTLQP